MKYRIYSKQYTVDSGEYTNNKKKTQILDCNCRYNTTKGSSPYYYYYNREKSCVKFCQDLDQTACDKAPMSILQASKSYICIDNSFNNPCGRLILFPYGFYNCESLSCSTCTPIPVDLSKNIVISNLQEATLNNTNNINSVNSVNSVNNLTPINETNNIINTTDEFVNVSSEPTRSTAREINAAINNNINNIGNSYRNIPKYTIFDFFSMY